MRVQTLGIKKQGVSLPRPNYNFCVTLKFSPKTANLSNPKVEIPQNKKSVIH